MKLLLSAKLSNNNQSFTFLLRSSLSGHRAPQAAHRAQPGERGAVLPGAVAPVRRPQLPQPEPLGRHPGARQEGHLRRRARRLLAHRDRPHPDHAAQNGAYAARHVRITHTGPPDRMSHRKWRSPKQQPSRARAGYQISCCLLSLHFLCDILLTFTVVIFTVIS